MKIFHLDASARHERSMSRTLSAEFVARLRELDASAEVDYLDLAIKAPPHIDELFTAAIYTVPADRSEAMVERLRESDDLCARLLAADTLVFAIPMYNWSPPSSFKAYIDNIIRPWLTWHVEPDGSYFGHLRGKKVLFLTTRGGDSSVGGKYESYDALTPALRAAFGFLDVHDPVFVDVQPLQYGGEEAKVKALENSRIALEKLAVEWTAV